MRMRHATFALLTALAPLTACDPVTEPAVADPDVPIEAMADETIADLMPDGYTLPAFDALARKVPGFAGYWFDRGCNLHVRLTDLSYADRVTALLGPVLRAKLAAEPHCPDTATIVVQGAEFSWLELVAWTRAVGLAAGIRGVVRMGISVPLNRIVVAVTGRPPAHEVIRLAERLDVPLFALKFVLASAPDDGGRRGG